MGNVKKVDYIYMMVTKDKYELPLCVGTPAEVAKYGGTTSTNVIATANHAEKKPERFWRYVRVKK